MLIANELESGSLTTSEFPDGNQNQPEECTRNFHTDANLCVTDRQTYTDGSWFPWGKSNTIRGDTIFVKTDCANRQRLPLNQQDPAYQHPGVALDQGLYDRYATFWEQGVENQVVALIVNNDNTKCAGSAIDSLAPAIASLLYAEYDDCVEALAELLQEAHNTLPIQNKNHQEIVKVMVHPVCPVLVTNLR